MQIKILFLSSLLTFVLSARLPMHYSRQALSYPDPEPESGNITGVHDPSVIKRTDGTFFRLSTNGDIAIASAPSMNGPWSYLGAMLPDGSSIDVAPDQQLWAPDVSNIGGTYYCYYAVSTLGSQASEIGLATSTTLEPGSWTDHGSIGLPKSSDYNLIDPNLFQQSADAPYYFSFGSAWDGIFQTQLTSPPTGQQSGAGINNIAQNTSAIAEGSFQFWWPNSQGQPYYYLFFSSGTCCQTANELSPPGDEYKIEVCRSDSPTGPFSDDQGRSCLTDNGGTLVLASHGSVYAPGGQGVLYDSATMKSPIVYYHYVNPSIGYDYEDFQFGWNYLDFSSGWPVVSS